MFSNLLKIGFNRIGKVFSSTSISTRFSYRKFLIEDLKKNDLLNRPVSLHGWLKYRRMNSFGVLRDHSGSIQFVLKSSMKDQRKLFKETPVESCLHIKGILRHRPEKDRNSHQDLGDFEIDVEEIEVLNRCLPVLPVDLSKYNDSDESTRLNHRYLDFRRDEMQHRLRYRSSFIARVRNFLLKHSFVDIETPSLFRRTPGGAREFLVPTHLDGGGLFYALTQSPQQFKQLLMIGGFDRYFQIAKCFRDETGRPDRQPEFTQIDLELSFVSQENIFQLIEELINDCWPDQLNLKTFPRLTYSQSMLRYGTDKPDTRFDLEIEQNSDEYFIRSPIPLTNLYDLTDQQIQYDQSGKFSMKKCSNEKHNHDDEFDEDSLIKMGKFRLKFADVLEKYYQMNLRKKRQWNFLWITDFPLFTRMTDDRTKFESTHHPFTAPIDQHYSWIFSREKWSKIIGQHYDLVLNGFEVGGGSIRIHHSDLQRFVLHDVLQLPIEHLEHLLKALEYGAPPHGGIALGLDRLLALALETDHIRDVIAFPKTSQGKDLMAKAPSLVEQSELDYYFLHIGGKYNHNIS